MLGDYNLELKHLPGTKNHADGLSRQPDYDQGEDNDVVTALPDTLFARVISDIAFNEQVHRQQKEHTEKIEEWKSKYNLRYNDGSWWKQTALVITGGELLRPRTILGRFISFCLPFPLTSTIPSTSFP